MTGAPGRPRLLMIGSGDRRYREYILAAVSARCDLWLLDAHEVTWQAPYLAGSVLVPDIHDLQALTAAARQVTRDNLADAVFCYAATTAHAAAPAPAPPVPPGGTEAGAGAGAAAAGSRVVIRAGGGPGSRGLGGAAAPPAAATGFPAASAGTSPGAPAYDAGVLVEELLTGPEISVDCVVADGACTITALAHKQTGLDPFFEETGHTVDARDPLLDDAVLRDQLDRVHKALDYTRGATHTEFRLTPDGPRLVEINARLGGDLIPYLGFLATGADPSVAAAPVPAGRAPDTP